MGFVISLACGLLFGLGLIGSGMTDPAKVQAFLDVAGAWDPSLALVMTGAVAASAAGVALARRRARAWCGGMLALPSATRIDGRLLGGALVFGVGWGLAGYCPGPALVALGGGSGAAASFVAAMLAGIVLHDRLVARPAAEAVEPG